MSSENEAAIKVIVELQARPGKRAELKNLLESVAAKYGPGLPGYLGSTRYEVLDNPDILVEIAEWASAEERGFFKLVMSLLAGSVKRQHEGDLRKVKELMEARAL